MKLTNLLSAVTADTVFMIVLAVVVLLFLIVFPMFTNKRRQKQVEKMHEAVVVGAEIKTVGGIIGTIVAIRDKSPVDKEIVIETGVDDNKATMVLDIQAVYQVLSSPRMSVQANEVSPTSTAGDDVFSESAPVQAPVENTTAVSDDNPFTPVTPVEEVVSESTDEPVAATVAETPEEAHEESDTAAGTEKAAVTPSANSSNKASTKKSSSKK